MQVFCFAKKEGRYDYHADPLLSGGCKKLKLYLCRLKLYISPSTLSKSILALEKELELQLFIRDRRGIRLTPGGALLCQRMTPFLDEMPNWIHQAQLANQGLNGTLRIGYLATQHIRYRLCPAHRRF